MPPFVMRETGAVVTDTAKIHATCFDLAELRIPLCLSGIFSYFQCRTPTTVDLTNAEDDRILLATPDGQWDHHSDHHAKNEVQLLLDFAGQMVPSNE
jgi:hypothetical protein